jgi:hypothetical protein
MAGTVEHEKALHDRATRRRSRPWLLGCLGVGLGLPLLCAAILFIVFRVNNQPPQIHVPTPTMPVPNAFDDFVRAGQLAKAMKHPSPASMPLPAAQRDTLANYEACANEAPPILRILRVALKKPYLYPPVRSFNAPTSQRHSALRELARTVFGAGEYYARVNQPGRAADIFLDGMEMGSIIPRGGSLLSDMVGISVETICTQSFEPLISKMSRAELEYVALRMEAIAGKRASWSEVVMETAWADAAGYQEVLREPSLSKVSPKYFSAVRELMGRDPSQPLTIRDALKVVQFGIASKTQMLLDNLEYYRKLAYEAERTVYTGRSAVPLPRNVLMDTYLMFGNAIVTFRAKHEQARSVQDLLRLEIALTRYRKDHGVYPATLSALAPVYLRSVPDDPLGGAPGTPFHYSVTGNRFLLYSLGTDLRDDGGTPIRFPRHQPGDIVAGKMWQPRKNTP